MTRFCLNLRCFVAKSVLSQFTHFCVEKNLFRNFACGEKRTNIRYAFFWPQYTPWIAWQCCAEQQWWGREMWNTGPDKYEIGAREIHIFWFSTFFGKRRVTFGKVTPVTKLVNEKKFWQAPLGPWHVLSWIWVFSGPWMKPLHVIAIWREFIG